MDEYSFTVIISQGKQGRRIPNILGGPFEALEIKSQRYIKLGENIERLVSINLPQYFGDVARRESLEEKELLLYQSTRWE